MDWSRDLAQVIEWCTSPIEGEHVGGRDLATADISVDGAAKSRHDILQAFKIERNVDWNAVYQDGLSILREQSKDVYALWAVLTPIPHVRKMGLEGVAASIEISNRFLNGDLWESLHPALPDGEMARAAVFTRLYRKWWAYVERTTFEPADAPMVHRLKDVFDEFARLLEERIAEGSRPSVNEMRVRLRAAAEQLPIEDDPEEAGQDEDVEAVEAETSVDAGQTTATRTSAAPAGDEILAAYESALRIVDRRPDAAIEAMTAVVDRQSQRNGQFRGRVYLGDLYLRAGKVRLARQMLGFLDEEQKTIKLEDWEPELCGKLWSTLYRAISSGDDIPKGDQDKLEELFRQVCRVDAKQAVALESADKER